MIRRPGPRLITDPVPAAVRALPIAFAIRAPIGLNSPWNPATTIGSNYLPSTVRRKRLIKIAFGSNGYSDRTIRDLDLRRGRLHVHYFARWGRFLVITATGPRLIHIAGASSH